MTVKTGENFKISALKKVTFSFTAGTQMGQNDLNPESSTFDIIYGLGVEGLTPFEFQITDKSEGDSICLRLDSHEVCRTFQHITLPHFNAPDANDPVFLQFQVEKVVEADSREIIKAMAEMSACSGDSCDCCGH